MSTKPKLPYYNTCPACGEHDLKIMGDGPGGKADYEYCECGHRAEGLGSMLDGPGIFLSMSTAEKFATYKNYFGDCCTSCGETKEVKVCGYTKDGRGIPFRLCAKCRVPEEHSLRKIGYDVKPKDEAYFNRHQIAKDHERKQEEKRKAIKTMGLKRPEVRRTGKTERKRANKEARS